MVRATKAEMLQRTTEVHTMLVKGASRPEILQFAAEKWEISERSTDTLIQRAKEAITKEAEAERESQFALALARMNMVYKSALKVQDYRVAIAAEKEKNKLLDLYTPPIAKIVEQLLALLVEHGQDPAAVLAAMKALQPQEAAGDGR